MSYSSSIAILVQILLAMENIITYPRTDRGWYLITLVRQYITVFVAERDKNHVPELQLGSGEVITGFRAIRKYVNTLIAKSLQSGPKQYIVPKPRGVCGAS